MSHDSTLDGYRVELTGDPPLSQSSLRVLLAAIRDFYAVMAEAGLYAYTNPMYSQLLQRWKHGRVKSIASSGASVFLQLLSAKYDAVVIDAEA